VALRAEGTLGTCPTLKHGKARMIPPARDDT